MGDVRTVDRIWFDPGVVASVARAALFPAEKAYAVGVAARAALYDRGLLRSYRPPIPALSVGNLSVGGTGKTPIAAWAAGELLAAGARPAIVLRGYGDDEPLVHRRLNPGVLVIASADRVGGAGDARRQGADVVVLDDAFQHRRIRREADWVLVSADQWTGGPTRLLPAGPWREPMSALRRASMAIVTRKAVTLAQAENVRRELRRHAPELPMAIAHLAPGALQATGSAATRNLDTLGGARVRLIAAVGNPAALRAQLESHGAVVDARFFPDHHAYTTKDIANLTADAGGTLMVCTLKDAVKLERGWPRAAPPLWYVSQRVIVEDGLDQLSRSIRFVLGARSFDPDAAGSSWPSP